MPNDVENTNCTNKGEDLWLVNKPWILPRRNRGDVGSWPEAQERYSTLIYISSASAIRNKKKSSNGVDSQQKGKLYGSDKLDNKLKMYKISVEVIKFMEKTMENCRVKMRRKLRWGKDPELYISTFMFHSLPNIFLCSLNPPVHFLCM